MNKNATILVFFILMLTAAGFSLFQYSQLVVAKDAVKKSKEEFRIMSEKNRNLADTNNIRLNQLAAINQTLNAYIEKYKKCFPDNDSLTTIMQESKTIAVNSLKLNDSTKYQQASKLEEEGFKAIAQNQFDVALSKFTQAEQVSPSYHMTYEISRLLKNEKPNFENPEIQKNIKEKIITDYSWKAPKEQLIILKQQVKH